MSCAELGCAELGCVELSCAELRAAQNVLEFRILMHHRKRKYKTIKFKIFANTTLQTFLYYAASLEKAALCIALRLSVRPSVRT